MGLPVMTIECKAAADPDMRFTPGGKAVMNLRVVCSDRRKNDAGEWEDSATLWLDVTAWEKVAENAVESVQRGDDLIIIGKLKTEEWEDKDTGAKRSKTVLTAYNVARSTRFHPVPHGAKTERSTASSSSSGASDPWSQAAPAQSDEPPF